LNLVSPREPTGMNNESLLLNNKCLHACAVQRCVFGLGGKCHYTNSLPDPCPLQQHELTRERAHNAEAGTQKCSPSLLVKWTCRLVAREAAIFFWWSFCFYIVVADDAAKWGNLCVWCYGQLLLHLFLTYTAPECTGLRRQERQQIWIEAEYVFPKPFDF